MPSHPTLPIRQSSVILPLVVPYALEPVVAGTLGEGTLLDPAFHPPNVSRVEYVLDAPVTDDLLESFPVFLISTELAACLEAAGVAGYELADATVVASEDYVELFGDAPHKSYRWLKPAGTEGGDCWLDSAHVLCVSDRLYDVLRQADLRNCDVRRLESQPR